MLGLEGSALGPVGFALGQQDSLGPNVHQIPNLTLPCNKNYKMYIYHQNKYQIVATSTFTIRYS